VGFGKKDLVKQHLCKRPCLRKHVSTLHVRLQFCITCMSAK